MSAESTDYSTNQSATGLSDTIEEEAKQYIAAERGWDRVVKYLIRKNSVNSDYYPERALIHQAVGLGAATTFFIASYFGSRNSYNTFIEVNRASAYSTKFTAERAAMDASVFGGLKQGMLYGGKTCLFIASFLSVSQALTVYRNKTSPLNYMIGGACTGALMRFHIGPRHLVAGSIIGSLIGVAAGALVYPIAKLTGETQEEIHMQRVCDMLRERRHLHAVSTNTSK